MITKSLHIFYDNDEHFLNAYLLYLSENKEIKNKLSCEEACIYAIEFESKKNVNKIKYKNDDFEHIIYFIQE